MKLSIVGLVDLYTSVLFVLLLIHEVSYYSYMLKGKKILLVDDTMFMRDRLVKELEKIGLNGFDVHQEDDGDKAYELLNKGEVKFDLIMSDVNMPRMDGITLLKKVRQSNKWFKDIKFLLVTTDSEKDKVIEALKYKVSGYIVKSSIDQKLEQEILRLLA